MHAKIFAAFLFSVLAVNALPAKRDDTAAKASQYQSQAKELLNVVQSEISAAGPSAAAYTAFITTIEGRPVVEMAETVSGKVWVAVTSGEPVPTARPAAADNAAAPSGSDSSAAASPSASGSASASASASGASDSASTSGTASMSSTAPSATGTKNAAAGLTASRPLLTGVVGALGAVGAGALMLL